MGSFRSASRVVDGGDKQLTFYSLFYPFVFFLHTLAIPVTSPHRLLHKKALVPTPQQARMP